MPTVLLHKNIRIVIYTNDHPPAHVHAVRGNEARAKFVLNCPHGPVELIEQSGFKLTEINEIGSVVASSLGEVCRKWSEIHG